MTPYYDEHGITIYHGDARQILQTLPYGLVVSDPPYNIGYHYDSYEDALSPIEYQRLLFQTFRPPSVLLHYSEAIINYCVHAQVRPEKCVAWVYNANTPRQWRMIAWFGVSPDFSLVRQPYKNLNDLRIRELLEAGAEGASLYDWWNIQQVKNIGEEKLDHPCQIPVEVMGNIIGTTPSDLIIDPFMGSGTTLVAAKLQGKTAIGIEINKKYCEMAAERLQQYLDIRPYESSEIKPTDNATSALAWLISQKESK